jgi:predicted RNA binding protein YcfA (HicA-like mRNA interferase family)
MTKPPIVDAKTMEKLLLRIGFEPVRQKGSDLARPLIREILREIELTPEQFTEKLRDI